MKLMFFLICRTDFCCVYILQSFAALCYVLLIPLYQTSNRTYHDHMQQLHNSHS